MKKLIIIFTFIALISIHLYAGDSVAFTLKAVGDVSLSRGEANRTINSGEELFNEDLLESNENSYAAIKFLDGSSIIKLFPRSILQIRAIKTEDNKLDKSNYLKVGEIWAKVVKKTGKFEIDTPTTVVSVKGTIFHLIVDEKGTTVYTYQGEVTLTNKGDGKSAIVGEGQTGTSTGQGDIDVVTTEGGEGDQEKILEINLENESGDKKTIKIEFE
ncbi:MAG: FecR domain-containing protein [Candidatus Cloacimonetes bacterium]|nr:FecR domain-containing protein [Candidatus Cloacimonadota bacterium]